VRQLSAHQVPAPRGRVRAPDRDPRGGL